MEILKRILNIFTLRKSGTPQFVDLGLPSGLKWAKCNVGATSATDDGDYFMWGSTTPNTADECTWAKAPFNDGNSYYNADTFKLMKDTACPNGILAKEYDAASQIMGGDWRMPTKDEIQELLDNTDNEWVTNYNGTGVKGRKFTSKSNTSKYIFIPAAGNCYRGLVYSVGRDGDVWSSSLNTTYPYNAWGLHFSADKCNIDYYFRYYSLPVRGVMK